MSENIKFVEGNVLDGLPFKDSTFDYVFMRHLCYGFTDQDWKNVIDEIIRITKPGGWIEVCNFYREQGYVCSFKRLI